MSKQLNEKDMQNELSGSTFFEMKSSTPSEVPASRVVTQASPQPRERADQVPESAERTAGPMGPRAQETVVRSSFTSDALIEEIRKVVRQPGKDEGTFRFTTSEKRGLTGIVYEYGMAGIKTSQSEITRIAINWLLADYQEAGEASVLARVLRRLNE